MLSDREALALLADEQAALQRVATLMASGASSTDLFAAVAKEVASVLRLPMVGVFRYDSDGNALTVVAVSSDRPHAFHAGTRWPLDGDSLSARVLRTGRPARVESYADLRSTLAAGSRESGVSRSAGAPIIVDGRVWGVMATSSPDAPFPDDVEARLGKFTGLVATAIANAESREKLTRLANEQAALRRIATLVARGAPPLEVFETVIAEVARLIPADAAGVARYETDGTATTIGTWSSSDGYRHVGTRHAVDKGTLVELILETRRPGRIMSYAQVPGALAGIARELGWRSSVGAPIIVEGRLWGVISVASTTDEPLAIDTETRLAQFSDLVATAISNSQTRVDLHSLAEEQAALRLVATLVARRAPPAEVFQAVSAEIGRLIPADSAGVARYETDGTLTALGTWARRGAPVPVGLRFAIEQDTLGGLIIETRLPARIDEYAGVPGSVAAAAREMGLRSSVGAPIIVEGRLWGVMAVHSATDRPLPLATEGRLAQFTELVATAIANTENRAELAASRARLVATADATRRRIERDLHDGAQQRLVSLTLDLRAAQARVPSELDGHRRELSRIIEGLTSVLDELREIAHGIHPAILAQGGLGPALKTLGRRSAVPVELALRNELRLPEPVEVAAYYFVAEALANAAKHTHASVVHVDVEARNHVLHVSVDDDGQGGADAARGSGLLGLKDRAEAMGGTFSLRSPRGGGTSIQVELPLDDGS